jgi:hypothetical protein
MGFAAVTFDATESVVPLPRDVEQIPSRVLDQCLDKKKKTSLISRAQFEFS